LSISWLTPVKPFGKGLHNVFTNSFHPYFKPASSLAEPADPMTSQRKRGGEIVVWLRETTYKPKFRRPYIAFVLVYRVLLASKALLTWVQKTNIHAYIQTQTCLQTNKQSYTKQCQLNQRAPQPALVHSRRAPG